jgi:hypothetical protein
MVDVGAAWFFGTLACLALLLIIFVPLMVWYCPIPGTRRNYEGVEMSGREVGARRCVRMMGISRVVLTDD